MNVLEALQKVADVEDQVLIGENRIQSNLDTAIKILQSSREADLGSTTNAVIEALIVIGKKGKLIVGRTDEADSLA